MCTPSPTPSAKPHRGTAPRTDRQHFAVFWEWCLRREALRIAPQLALTLPLVLLEAAWWLTWPQPWHANQGVDLLLVLVGIAAVLILGGGAIHASQAFCWEVSPELRELVRLTGIGPVTLLCCKSLARWLTIGCSVLLLAPPVSFAITLGGVTTAHLGACGAVLLMLAALTAGMALVAGVSATDSQNSSTTAVMGTLLLLLLYHVIFWLTAGVIYQPVEKLGDVPSVLARGR